MDILADGSLDLKDDILKECEVVLGSVHSRFNMEEGEMTRRIIKALKNPNVKILAHPTGRLILEREPYQVNFKEVIQAAIDYGVALEINAYPDRLDLKDVDARMAKDMGAKLAISTDAHSVHQLEIDEVRGLHRPPGVGRSEGCDQYPSAGAAAEDAEEMMSFAICPWPFCPFALYPSAF